jgi:monoamine oxidase
LSRTGATRREILLAAGAGATALALGPGERAAAESGGVDVVVVGGGFAGVTAARDCALAGLRTVLLEARERLGGRTFTAEFAGHSIELGGTWIHWLQPYVWAETQRYGLPVVETPELGLDLANEELIALVGGKPVSLSGDQLAGAAGALERYFAPARLAWNRPYDSRYAWAELLKHDATSAGAALARLDLDAVQRAVLEGYLLTMAHCPIDEVGYVDMLRWWSLAGFSLSGLNDSSARYKLAGGTRALIESMIAHGRPAVRLSSTVERIEEREDGVAVSILGGEALRAELAVIALPLNVLPSVAFSPPLDARLMGAAKERHAGRGIKLYALAKGRATRAKKATALAPAPHALSYALTYAIDDAHTLFVCFGPDPARLRIGDRAAVQAAMRAWFPGIEIEDTTGWSWTEDPFARGTWATFRPGWLGRYADAFERDRGRLLFASADVGEGWRGFIDGAIGAGQRAARRAVERMRGASPALATS